MNNEKIKIIIGMIFIIFAMFLLIGGISGYVLINMNSNNNGVNKTSGGTTVNSGSSSSGSSGGVKIVSGAININNKGYNTTGNYKPAKGATSVLVLNSFYMTSELTKGQDLYNKIFLLPPNTNFKGYATFYVTGANINKPINIKFYLEQGSLPGGALKHIKNTKVLTEGTKIFANGLSKGKHTIEISGTTPNYDPGHDWYLGYITATIGNTIVIKYEIHRTDEPSRLKWMALQYKNTWCIPKATKIVNGCFTVSGLNNPNTPYVIISVAPESSFGSSAIGLMLNNRNVKYVKVYEITYPGKALLVYSDVPGGNWQLVGSTYYMKIPKHRFATVTPNEAYLKIDMYNVDNRLINLNTATNDKAARINIPIQIIGSTEWTYTRQYFDSIGIISFDTFASASQSPEKQYFTSVW